MNYGLTPREKEVLERMSHGDSAKEIADGLGVKLSTVKTHEFRVIGKLGTNSALKAVCKAFREGLVR